MNNVLHLMARLQEGWIALCTGRDSLHPLDEEHYRQRILAIGSFFWLLTVVIVTVITPLAIELSPEGRLAATSLFVISGLSVLASILILRYLNSRIAALHMLLLVYTGVFAVACAYFGGTRSPTYALLIMAPVMASIVGGTAAGIFWTGLVLLIWAVILGLERLGMQFQQIIVPQNYNFAITLAYGAMGLAVVSIIMVYAEMNRRLRQALQSANSELDYLSTHDDLTGLYNRRFYEQRMAKSLQRARSQGRAVGLLIFDLDDFKQINDTHGHGMGDALLKKLGERLQSQVRETDLIARLGGDEFVVLMEDLRSPEDLPLIAAKLVAAVEQPVKLRDQLMVLSASCGVAVYPQDGSSQTELEEKADKAMYRAKHRGATALQTVLH
ncbi:diguanylate cyclase [Seongchinamella sediminis]|uniref:Diguanylate cyclase n=1 Tax=Seongchinamella sediminis TaxID=2283635 RepID=A0A3L7DYD1_9GAMM|nr:GGDEF domain-containing protein [Seongchinamella sediminis]RLQ21133.1 diguanylate cyclase [Seongchinamella sediminis]